MARGEWNDGPVRWARPLAFVGCLGVALLAVGGAVLRPWHVERPLLDGTDVASVRRGNMLGSSCELVRQGRSEATPWRCGSSARWPDYGGQDVIQVLDVYAERACAVERETLRTIGCVEPPVDWMQVGATSVSFATWRDDRASGSSRVDLVRFDRASGARRVVTLPPAVSPYFAGDDLVLVAWDATTFYGVDDGGVRVLDPAEGRARYDRARREQAQRPLLLFQ